MIRFRCSCGKKLKAPPDKAGAVVGCPTCLARVTVPEPPPPQEVDLAEPDDEPDPSPVPRKPKRPPRRERDDGVPIRRRDYEWEEPIRSRRPTGHDQYPLLLLIGIGVGFGIACIGIGLGWLTWAGMNSGERLRWRWGIHDSEERATFLISSLMSGAGGLAILAGAILASIGWAYYGNRRGSRMYRVATIAGWSALFVYSGVSTAFKSW